MADEKHVLSYEEISKLLAAFDIDEMLEKKKQELINARYIYAITLKLKGDKEAALREIQECIRMVGGDWPDKKMEQGISEMLKELS